MADILKKITLTEVFDAGPYFDAFYSVDCINYTQSVDGDNVYLPNISSVTYITVPEETQCIKLQSVPGECDNEVIVNIVPPTTTTTTSTTLAPTTTTTTSTTVAPSGLFSYESTRTSTPVDVSYIDAFGNERSFSHSSGIKRYFVGRSIVSNTGSNIISQSDAWPNTITDKTSLNYANSFNTTVSSQEWTNGYTYVTYVDETGQEYVDYVFNGFGTDKQVIDCMASGSLMIPNFSQVITNVSYVETTNCATTTTTTSTSIAPTTTTTTSTTSGPTTTTTTSTTIVSCNCITVDVLNTQLTDGGLDLYYILNACGVGETAVNLATTLGQEQDGSTYFGFCNTGTQSTTFKYGPSGSPFPALPGMNVNGSGTICTIDGDCPPVLPTTTTTTSTTVAPTTTTTTSTTAGPTTTTTSTTVAPTTTTTTSTTLAPGNTWSLFCGSQSGGGCEYSFTKLDGTICSDVVPEDTDTIFCVKDGTTPNTTSGVWTQIGDVCSFDSCLEYPI